MLPWIIIHLYAHLQIHLQIPFLLCVFFMHKNEIYIFSCRLLILFSQLSRQTNFAIKLRCKSVLIWLLRRGNEQFFIFIKGGNRLIEIVVPVTFCICDCKSILNWWQPSHSDVGQSIPHTVRQLGALNVRTVSVQAAAVTRAFNTVRNGYFVVQIRSVRDAEHIYDGKVEHLYNKFFDKR